MRSPLTWTLHYAGFAPNRLQEVLDQNVRGDELQRFIISYLLIHFVTKYRPGVMRILEGLHFPVTTTTFSDHRLNGAINGGGETIYARTSGGGITLNAK